MTMSMVICQEQMMEKNEDPWQDVGLVCSARFHHATQNSTQLKILTFFLEFSN